MHYRMTTFSYDPAREGEVIALADSIRDQMKAIDGLQSACSVRIADGKSVTIGVYDTAESAVAAQPKVGELLGRLADLLNAPPEVQEGPVFWEL